MEGATPSSDPLYVAAQLISSSVNRCRPASTPSRITVTISTEEDSVASDQSNFSLSVSDTGPGTYPKEFENLKSRSMCLDGPIFGWDGLLSITTTGVGEKNIRHYHVKAKHNMTLQVLELYPDLKPNMERFSGTKTVMRIRGPVDEAIFCTESICQKISILQIKNLFLELSLERLSSSSKYDNKDMLICDGGLNLQRSLQGLDCIIVGLTNYISRYLYPLESSRESVAITTGSKETRGMNWNLHVCIAITRMQLHNNEDHSAIPRTKVLFFENFTYSYTPASVLRAIENVKWHKFGQDILNTSIDMTGDGIIRWECPSAFTNSVFVIHKSGTSRTFGQKTESRLIKDAIEGAMSELKGKLPHLFLSSHAKKVQSYAPDLSRCIASLVKSSNDAVFRAECAAIVGLPFTRLETLEGLLSNKISDAIQNMDKLCEEAGDSESYDNGVEGGLGLELENYDTSDDISS